jgi:N-acetylglucosaminyl-diphospho-decaprenol L-rhamnosyltransferase
VSKGDYVLGPCLAISTKNFWAVGGFDERLFLYREEETLARKLSRIGVGYNLDPQVNISHAGGVSTSQAAEFSFCQSVRSEVLFYVLHFPRFGSAFLTLTLWIRLLIGYIFTPLLRNLGIRPQAQPASWYMRAMPEIIKGWRAKPVEPPHRIS